MRLIDADALMKNWERDRGRMFDADYFIFTIEHAPTIEAVPQWIPCKERMPKKEIPYQRRGYYLTTNAYGNVDLTRYEFGDDFQKTGWQSDIRIIAWMPLPKPYAERKSDE